MMTLHYTGDEKELDYNYPREERRNKTSKISQRQIRKNRRRAFSNGFKNAHK
jgi:hypothetical protein